MKDCLKNSGLKSTKQRIAILNILEESSQPVSAEDIYGKLLEDKLSVSLSTIYRSLETMVSKQLVTKLSINVDNKALYEINRMIHTHHLICLECKKIITLNYCPLENYEVDLANKTGFKVVGHKLDVFGYCPECAKKVNIDLD